MARGRMITNLICRDKAVHELSNDTCRLAFTWLITFADCDGRVYGDPAIIRSMLFPRREDVTIDQMAGYIEEWAVAGLVYWYECENDQWILFPKFEKNQPGLRKDREPDSDIPEYDADNCRIIAGSVPEECPVKRREVKLKEEKRKGDDVNIFELYEQNIGSIPKIIADELIQAEKDYPAEWFPAAFAEAAKNNARKWSYIKAILNNWNTSGFMSGKNKSTPSGTIKFDNAGCANA